MLKAKPKIKLPYEFISPYPPDECAERLEMKRGSYLGVAVHVDIEPQELKGYRFRIAMYREGIKVGVIVNPVLDGLLENVKNVGTRVVIDNQDYRRWQTINVLLPVVIGAIMMIGMFLLIFSSQTAQILGWVFIVLFVLVVRVIVGASNSLQSFEKIVWLVEETLTYQEADAVSSRIPQVPALIYGEKPKRGH